MQAPAGALAPTESLDPLARSVAALLRDQRHACRPPEVAVVAYDDVVPEEAPPGYDFKLAGLARGPTPCLGQILIFLKIIYFFYKNLVFSCIYT